MTTRLVLHLRGTYRIIFSWDKFLLGQGVFSGALQTYGYLLSDSVKKSRKLLHRGMWVSYRPTRLRVLLPLPLKMGGHVDIEAVTCNYL